MQQSQLITQSKIIFREKSKKDRALLFERGALAVISKQITDNILSLDIFKNSKNILFYYPKKDEIDLRGIFKEDKDFFLPKCNGKNLDICPFKSEDDLALGSFGIYEPKTSPIEDLSIIDIVFIPALCADKNFNRIGYGGGFYDRFLLNKTLRAKKIIVIPDELLYDSLPTETTDIKSDVIITQTLKLFCNIS